MNASMIMTALIAMTITVQAQGREPIPNKAVAATFAQPPLKKALAAPNFHNTTLLPDLIDEAL